MKRLAVVSIALLSTITILFAASCQHDQSRKLVGPARPGTAHIPSFSSATTTASGASFTTDKDDYVPGDTLKLAGAGWQAGDSLDILLDETPQNHAPVSWAVGVDSGGGFRDSSYVVQESDLGVTFALTATSRATGEMATATFTDAGLQLNKKPAPDPFSPNADLVKDVDTIFYKNAGSSGASGVYISIRQGTASGGALIRQFTVGDVAKNATGSIVWDGKSDAAVVVVEDLYGIRIWNGSQAEATNPDQTALVDYTAPVISSPGVSPASLIQGSITDVTVTGTATDNPATGVDRNNYKVVSGEYKIDAGSFSAMTVSATGGNVRSLSATIPGSAVQALSAGSHLVCIRATDDAGNRSVANAAENANCATLQITNPDVQPPTINCPRDQTVWYGDNVTVNCTASDAGSGLANQADAAFSLSTNVALGTETASATTGSHQVCDNNGNCATAGPYAFMVDRKAPSISCGSADGLWHATDASIACTASDGGSGLAAAGDASFNLTTAVPSGTEDGNASTGSRTVLDAVGNSATAGPISGNMIDKKAPVVSCGVADGQWHANDVSIACTASDGGSGLAAAGDASFNLTTAVPSGTEDGNASTGSRTVLDAVGNKATAGPISGNKVDKKGPVVTLVCPTSPVILGSTASASWTASDGGSGVATGYQSGSISLATGSVGAQTGTTPAGTSVDNVGNNSDAASCNYSVVYDWAGFFQPVDNTNLNVARAGSAIPVKFNLGGYQGLAIFMSGYPKSVTVVCDNHGSPDAIEETVTAGGSSLTYDFTASQYVYVWKSDKTWAGTCRRLDVKLVDGTTHSAYFKWTK